MDELEFIDGSWVNQLLSVEKLRFFGGRGGLSLPPQLIRVKILTFHTSHRNLLNHQILEC